MIELVHATLPLIDAAIADQAALAKLLDAEVAPGWEGFPEALPYLREDLQRDADTTWRSRLFMLKSPRTLVGLGGFKGAPREGVVEIGYAIAPEFQQRGLASSAAGQLVELAFVDSRVSSVDAHTLGEHNASCRVLEKLGMRRIGELHDSKHGVIWHWRISR